MNDPIEVRRWIDEVEGELDRLERQMSPLLEQQVRLRQRLGLLRDLEKTFGPQADSEARLASESRDVTPYAEKGSVNRRVVEQTKTILREAGKPLHIAEIHEEFLRCGYEVPGAGLPSNLVVHLTRSDDVISLSRGVYGLPGQRATEVVQKRSNRKR